jgi:basic membrane lipoprotein Med (substrate-binding protein (PBP1-ABC) superfamily)
MKKKGVKKEKSKRGTASDFKSALKETASDFKRYIGAISEDFQHRTAAIAEQYTSIRKTQDAHTEMIDTVAEDVSILKEKTAAIERIERDVAITKEDAEFIKSGMKRKVDFEEFAALERRVSLLEKQRGGH